MGSIPLCLVLLLYWSEGIVDACSQLTPRIWQRTPLRKVNTTQRASWYGLINSGKEQTQSFALIGSRRINGYKKEHLLQCSYRCHGSGFCEAAPSSNSMDHFCWYNIADPFGDIPLYTVGSAEKLLIAQATCKHGLIQPRSTHSDSCSRPLIPDNVKSSTDMIRVRYN
jgi:hypothetical protein